MIKIYQVTKQQYIARTVSNIKKGFSRPAQINISLDLSALREIWADKQGDSYIPPNCVYWGYN